MQKRRNLIEAVLFLPAMAALAVAVFGGMYLVIKAGGWLLRGWFGVLVNGLGLPRSIALSLAVMLAALCVYGAFYLLENRRRS